MTEAELLRGVLRHCEAERCRLAPMQTHPANSSISAEIEANAVLDHETRTGLAQLQQRKESDHG